MFTVFDPVIFASDTVIPVCSDPFIHNLGTELGTCKREFTDPAAAVIFWYEARDI
jgi:hypothetical protein